MADRILSKGFLSGADFVPSAPGPAPGFVQPPTSTERWIGRYRVEGELARGGMGVVFRALDEELSRPVAIKRPAPGMSPPGLERFQREARASAGLRHPNVVGTYEVGHDEAGPYLVMELIPGPSLQRVLEEEQALTPRRAAEITAELAAALAHAHQAGILHRDVKPGNVLMRPVEGGSDQAVLGDFGLAKPLTERGGPTLTGQVLGSPGYMAPEQFRGQALDARADVYSLGATLYECLAGAPPFEAESIVELIRLVETEDPTPPVALRGPLPEALVAVCLRCLERLPEDRYASAAELGADLERFLAGEPVLARPPGTIRKAWRWARRRWAGGVVAAAALICTGVIALALRNEQQGSLRADATRLLDQAVRNADRFSKAPPPPKVREELVAEVKLALGFDPTQPNRIRAATVLSMLGDQAEAGRILEDSIRAHPPGYTELEVLHRFQEGGRSRGGLSASQARALASAKRWPDLQPDHPFLAWSRAREATVAGDLPRAIHHYDQAIAAGLSGLLLDRGVLHKRLGNFPAAREDLLAVQEIDPRHPWPCFNLGLIEVECGNLRAAEKHLSQAIALDGKFLPARSERGLVRLLLGERSKGNDDLAEVLRRDPRGERFAEATWQAAMALALASCGQDPIDARLWGHGPAHVSER